MKSTSSTAAASWETALGKDVMDRTKNLANDMNDFRKLANLPAVVSIENFNTKMSIYVINSLLRNS